MTSHSNDESWDHLRRLTSTFYYELDEHAHLYLERSYFSKSINEDLASAEDCFVALSAVESIIETAYLRALLAYFLIRDGQRELAIYWSLASIELMPREAKGHYIYGLVCLMSGFSAISIQAFQTAQSLDENYWDAMRLQGAALRENCQLQESIELLTAFVTKFPNDALATYELGWTYHVFVMDEDHIEKAVCCYRSALQKNPDQELEKIILMKLRSIKDTPE